MWRVKLCHDLHSKTAADRLVLFSTRTLTSKWDQLHFSSLEPLSSSHFPHFFFSWTTQQNQVLCVCMCIQRHVGAKLFFFSGLKTRGEDAKCYTRGRRCSGQGSSCMCKRCSGEGVPRLPQRPQPDLLIRNSTEQTNVCNWPWMFASLFMKPIAANCSSCEANLCSGGRLWKQRQEHMKTNITSCCSLKRERSLVRWSGAFLVAKMVQSLEQRPRKTTKTWQCANNFTKVRFFYQLNVLPFCAAPRAPNVKEPNIACRQFRFTLKDRLTAAPVVTMFNICAMKFDNCSGLAACVPPERRSKLQPKGNDNFGQSEIEIENERSNNLENFLSTCILNSLSPWTYSEWSGAAKHHFHPEI